MKNCLFKIITALFLLMLLPFNVSAKTEPIAWNDKGEITYNFEIDGKSYEELLNDGYELVIENDTYLEDITNVCELYFLFESKNISITIEAFDLDGNPFGHPVDVDIVLDFYAENIGNKSAIDSIKITGNEIGTQIELDDSQFYQYVNDISDDPNEGRWIFINESKFKDFSINHSKATINYLKSSNSIGEPTIVDLEGSTLVKSIESDISNKKIRVENDNDNLYLKSDISGYIDNVSFIHIYGITYIAPAYYDIDYSIVYGDNHKAYDINSTLSLLDTLDSAYPRLELPDVTNNEIKIPLETIKDITNGNHDAYIIDIYSDGFVTYHKEFEIKPIENKKEEPSNPTPIPQYIPPRTDVGE